MKNNGNKFQIVRLSFMMMMMILTIIIIIILYENRTKVEKEKKNLTPQDQYQKKKLWTSIIDIGFGEKKTF